MRRAGALLLAFAVLAVVAWLSISLGARDVPPHVVLEALFAPDAANADHVAITELRLPRTLIGLAVGLALGVSGAIMQGITRNPIADPGLLGVNAGASLFIVLAISVLGITSPAGYIWFAFAGAAGAALLVYGIGALGRGGLSPAGLAIAGTALTAGLTSIITLLLITDVQTLSAYRFWAVGSLAGRDLGTLVQLLPFLVLGILLAALAGRSLNLLALGDDLARGLGQNLTLARLTSGVAVVLLCGAATALAGPIVFVGLVVPHLIRPFTGPDHRWLLIFSAIVGPIVLLAADVVGRLIIRPAELEAGLVVALIGAPMLIALVRRTRVEAL